MKLTLFTLLGALSVASQKVWVVENGSKSNVPEATKLAVQVCVGLMNRNPSKAGSAYSLERGEDYDWLNNSKIVDPPVDAETFLQHCLSSGIATGYIRYEFEKQLIVLPNLITVAAVLDAIPLEDSQISKYSVPLIFDAVKEWEGFKALEATRYVYQRWVGQTGGMSKMNPGLVAPPNNPLKPELIRRPALGLTDYIVKEKLFNFFLWFGCIPFSEEKKLLEEISTNNPWPKPIPVFGYDNSWEIFGGDLWEAETYCVKSKNMGQVASENVNNLSFFSIKPKITNLKQNPTSEMKYDGSKTYISFVIGDGDNIKYKLTNAALLNLPE
jgi:hypothetical protein